MASQLAPLSIAQLQHLRQQLPLRLCVFLLQERVKELVVREVSFSEEDGERFERDLKGTWEACGVNSTLLFARY